MDLASVFFVPRRTLLDQRLAVEHAAKDPDPLPEEVAEDGSQAELRQPMKVADIEKADTLEALGISEFYNGDYHSAMEHLNLSMSFKFPDRRRSSRRICTTLIFLALARFRLGDLVQSDEDLQEAARVAQDGRHLDLCAVALTNRAVILGRKEVLQQAILQSRKAIELSAEIHSHSSYEHLQHVRTLVSLYIKSREFSKAEIVLEESSFPPAEAVLLEAGLAVAQGYIEKAFIMLHEAYLNIIGSPETAAPVVLLDAPAGAHLVGVATAAPQIGEQSMLEGDGFGVGESKSAAPSGDLLGQSLMSESMDEHAVRHQAAVEALLQRVQILYNLHMVGQMRRMPSERALLSSTSADSVPLPPVDSRRLLADATRLLRSVVGQLYQQRQAGDERMERIDTEHDLFMFGPGPRQPLPYLPYDHYQHSVALWSALLLAKAEELLMGVQYTHGTRIQAGEVVLSSEPHGKLDAALAKALGRVELVYKAALGALEACKTHALSADVLFVDRTESQDPAGAVQPSATIGASGEAEQDKAMEAGAEMREGAAEGEGVDAARCMENDAESLLSDVAEQDQLPSDDPDIALAKDSLCNFQLLQAMHQRDTVNAVVSAEARNLLRDHDVDFNPQTGQLVTQATKRLARTLHEPDASRPSSADVAGLDTYIAARVDRITARAELVPLLERFGRDEVAGWLTWAIANCGGLSFGYLGAVVVHTGELRAVASAAATAAGGAGASMGDAVSEVPTAAFLVEVRNRLLELDVRLAFAFEHDEMYRFGELEQRVVVLLLVVRLTAQLALKPDVSPPLLSLLRAARTLNASKPCIESRVYLALAQRFKLDYEEWLLAPFMGNEERAHRVVDTLLPLAKAYFRTALTIPEAQLRLDAYKKMINIYTALNKCFIKSLSSSSGSVQSAGSINSAVGKELTLQEVRELEESVLDQCESGDVTWAMRHSKHRAKILFEDMKTEMMRFS